MEGVSLWGIATIAGPIILLGLFVFVILGTLLWVVARINIFSLFRYLAREFLLIVATSSSESALPRLIAKMEHIGVSRSTVGVVVPTGYSFNLDGTAIYLTMASNFIADAMNMPLSIGEQFSRHSAKGVVRLHSAGAEQGDGHHPRERPGTGHQPFEQQAADEADATVHLRVRGRRIGHDVRLRHHADERVDRHHDDPEQRHVALEHEVERFLRVGERRLEPVQPADAVPEEREDQQRHDEDGQCVEEEAEHARRQVDQPITDRAGDT